MNLRQDKQQEFFIHHMDTFRKLGIPDPFFVIKTAFFQKGKYGRNVQFFDSELKKGEDIYIELYDNVTDNTGKIQDIVPFHSDRVLCKYKFNPHYAEEYEQKENTNSKGELYYTYIIPLAELIAVNSDGREMSYPMYEKSKSTDTDEVIMPRLQNSLFPNFEEEFAPKKESVQETVNTEIADAPLSEITIRDLAGIMLMQPISARPWLNEIIKQAKKEL